jgi:hypothetical protein
MTANRQLTLLQKSMQEIPERFASVVPAEERCNSIFVLNGSCNTGSTEDYSFCWHNICIYIYIY